jgi:hypothetical protein
MFNWHLSRGGGLNSPASFAEITTCGKTSSMLSSPSQRNHNGLAGRLSAYIHMHVGYRPCNLLDMNRFTQHLGGSGISGIVAWRGPRVSPPNVNNTLGQQQSRDHTPDFQHITITNDNGDPDPCPLHTINQATRGGRFGSRCGPPKREERHEPWRAVRLCELRLVDPS